MTYFVFSCVCVQYYYYILVILTNFSIVCVYKMNVHEIWYIFSVFVYWYQTVIIIIFTFEEKMWPFVFISNFSNCLIWLGNINNDLVKIAKEDEYNM